MQTRTDSRKAYRRPGVASEKVFEQAALSCSLAKTTATKTHLKNDQSICGYAHS